MNHGTDVPAASGSSGTAWCPGSGCAPRSLVAAATQHLAPQPQLSSPEQGHGGRVRSWWLSRTSSPKATSTALLLGALLGCVGSVWVLLGPVPGKAKPRGGGSWGCTGRRRWACPHGIGSRMVAWAPAAADPAVPRRAFARRGGAREMPSQCHRDPGTAPRRCSLVDLSFTSPVSIILGKRCLFPSFFHGHVQG